MAAGAAPRRAAATGHAGRDESIFQTGRGRIDLDAEPDFDSLIELIRSTVHPITWDEVGGPGSIAHFKTNLSLVISQTQEVSEPTEIINRLSFAPGDVVSRDGVRDSTRRLKAGGPYLVDDSESMAFHNRGSLESDVVPLVNRSESMSIPDAMTPPRELGRINLNTTAEDDLEIGRVMLGVGVNSDAGVVNNVVLDEQNFEWDKADKPLVVSVAPVNVQENELAARAYSVADW